MQSLRAEVGHERAQEWEQAMQARRDAEATRVAQLEAHNKRQYKKTKVDCRDGHGIPKCSPCPSMVFLMPPSPSIRFRVFLGWRVRMSIIRTAEIPKIGKTGAKIRASIC